MNLTTYLRIFCFLLLSSSWHLFAQSDLLNGLQNHITINHEDGSKEVFEVSDASVQTNTQKLYHWYAAQKTHRTQGGYSGKLLDGAYSFYYPDKQLATQGEYRKGLAQGEWKEWRRNHRLAKVETWKKGLLSGAASQYDEEGKLLMSGKKKDGAWHGKVYSFMPADSSYQWTYYAQGESISREAYVDANIFRRTGRFFENLWTGLFRKKEQPQTNVPE